MTRGHHATFDSNRCALWLACCAILASLPLTASGQVVGRVSVSTAGVGGNHGSGLDTSHRAISADGRYVVFESDADNLVADDGNGLKDVFVRDVVAGTTTLVSVSRFGGSASGTSENPSLSLDGRFVAFASDAYDLVEGDGNDDWDVFVRDLQLGTTTRVSVSTTGGDPDGSSNRPSVDAVGTHVVYSSTAQNLVSGPNTSAGDVYLYNVPLGQTSLVSVALDGSSGDANSWLPEISPDGTVVAFVSGASNLVSGDDGGSPDVFVRDLTAATTTRVSIDTTGDDPDDRSGPPSLSTDGRFVAFWSRATDLVPGDTNGQDDIFVHDRVTGDTQRMNVSTAGDQALGAGSWHAAITGSGRFVLFLSDASNLVPGDDNGWGDIFVHDRLSGATWILSRCANGEFADGFSRFPSVTPNGMWVVFESTAESFLPGDENLAMDVYLARGPAWIFSDGFESGDPSAWAPVAP